MFFTLMGCSKIESNDVIDEFKNNINNKSYILTGVMDIVSNEELYHYDVNVKHMDDYYRASLINKDTNYEQIILKNDDGVYVVTPSLNKSFKYQSEWPFNSSQSYILESLLNDLLNDSEVAFEEKDDSYILMSTVNYPNNSNLLSQKITFNKDFLPSLVEVYDKEGVVNITFNISKIDFDTKLTSENFSIEESTCDECSSEVSVTDETVYPMYLPEGTSFINEEVVDGEDTKRVILTFAGDSEESGSFTLIEEVSALPSEFEVTTTSGELVFYENVLGNLNESSLNWNMNGKDYYIISNNLSNEELLKIAASTSVVALSK